MYKIYGIQLGDKNSEGRKLLPEVEGVEAIYRISYYMWCIKGDGLTVLVDTGMKNKDVAKRKLYNIRDPITQLKKIDVDPGTIQSVIVTHLHSDHFSAYELYPKAKFSIQRKEIEFFTGPALRFRQLIRTASDMVAITRLGYEKRIHYVDGDEQVFPGIRVALVGGHTPGSQVVVVATRKGDVVLCSDALDLYRNLEEEVAAPMVNLAEGLLAWDKMKRLASSRELIIPGHDSLIMSRFPNPVDGIVEIG